MSRLLQRKCACGGTPGPAGECAECRKKRLGLQRKEVAQAPAMAPPIVHDVLRAPGRPLEPETRSFMENRFGHDFGRVRVHADAEAAESARSVGALAYTVGNHVAFDHGRYAPGSGAGKELLAHELAHVVQQGASAAVPASGGLPISPAGDALESQADSAASAVLHGMEADPGRTGGAGLQRSAKAAPASCGSFTVDMTPFMTGMRGSVELHPDPATCPTCKLIRLVQIVRVFSEPGTLYEWKGREAQREKVKTREKRSVQGGFFVDHKAATCSKGEGCSLYYREHAPNLMRSQDGFNDGTTAEPATLWDVPDGGPDSIFEFETCARCHDTGQYLGCVDWGFSSDAAGNATATSPFEHVSPSETFDAAVKKFDKFYKNR